MITPSFLRVPGEVVKEPTWTIRVGGTLVDDKAAKGWDYATPVDVVFRCEATLSELHRSVQLAPGSEVALILRWHATGTGLRGTGEPRRIEGGSHEVCLHLDGDSLGGTLVLNAVLILLAPASGDSGPLAPTRPGSVLWSEPKKVILEGDGLRFPVELISFEGAGLRGPNAGWCLRWDSQDYDQAAGACLRLQFNRDHEGAAAAATNPQDPRNAAFMQALRWDIARQMILAALDDETHFDSLDWPERSLGAALVARIGTVFPGLSLDECRSLRRSNPEDFETSLQSAMGLFT